VRYQSFDRSCRAFPAVRSPPRCRNLSADQLDLLTARSRSGAERASSRDERTQCSLAVVDLRSLAPRSGTAILVDRASRASADVSPSTIYYCEPVAVIAALILLGRLRGENPWAGHEASEAGRTRQRPRIEAETAVRQTFDRRGQGRDSLSGQAGEKVPVDATVVDCSSNSYVGHASPRSMSRQAD